MTATLRPADDHDVMAVAGIWHRGWADGHHGHVPVELHDYRRKVDFLALVPSRIAHTTVAEVDDRVVGFVTVRHDEVEEMYVDGPARGTGVAAELLRHGEAVVALTHDRAWLAVVAGNVRARRFYERCGWVDGGELAYESSLPDGRTLTVPVRRYEKSV